MKQKILSQILILTIFVGLIPFGAWGQDNNGTSTGSPLRIVIPAREFSEFVSIKYNPVTGENNFSGFAIEVFNEVMNSLPSPVSFKYVAYQKPDGTMNGTFDTMLKAVFDKDYAGAVGEISILHYRTTWVDFTMPYTEDAITMLVPVVKEPPTIKAAGFSLIGITYAFLITAFVIGFIAFIDATVYGCIIFKRHFRNNDDNRPRDRTMGSLIQTRLMITSFFLILLTPIACYIISQTTLNTPQRGSPTIKNLTELMRKGSNVGYREGSFIYNLLKHKGFDDSKLKTLKSEEDMANKLYLGTSKGGVDAIVANAPQLKLLLAKHCGNFTIVPITGLHTTGFGFAFGTDHSDLLEDVSKGILRLIDYGGLAKIQDRTIGNYEACGNDPNKNIEDASSIISPNYKWILIAAGLLIGLLIIVSFGFSLLTYIIT